MDQLNAAFVDQFRDEVEKLLITRGDLIDRERLEAVRSMSRDEFVEYLKSIGFPGEDEAG